VREARLCAEARTPTWTLRLVTSVLLPHRLAPSLSAQIAATVLPVLSWNHDTISFVALTLLATLWGLLHLALSLLAARTARLPVWLRSLGWLPPLTPIAGFLSGARIRSIVWCIVAATYLVIRTRV
jgi:hypothetical protein